MWWDEDNFEFLKEEERRAELMERAAKRTEEQIQWDEELEESKKIY